TDVEPAAMADRGRERAGSRLAVVLRDLGRWQGLERRAGQGDAGAALTLADAQTAEGRPDRALRALELGFDSRAEETGAAPAYSGRVEESVDLLRGRGHAGVERDARTTRLLLELHRSRSETPSPA
ncbi:MAG TPA: hypothetical protein K8V84_07360, partial [Nocardiopsis listeri]|uniref:hypothetical protein n=1 Tax=Nocardiopsis listeri TaxID=53440 RepID=UPI001E0AFFFA